MHILFKKSYFLCQRKNFRVELKNCALFAVVPPKHKFLQYINTGEILKVTIEMAGVGEGDKFFHFWGQLAKLPGNSSIN